MKKVEYPSGILKFNPANQLVSADSRKGKILFEVSPDNEKRFQWFQEGHKNPELDLYLFREDAEF